jgi:outer membrane receptor protein involved in Fe transport
MYSILGEYQWDINEQWLMILGGRYDQHSYSDEMLSPRGALIYKVNKRDTLKFLVSQSQRTNNATEMRNTYLDSGSNSATEEITNYEIRWEREHSKNLFWGLSTYYHDMELLAYNENESRSTIVGEQSIFGADLEVKYTTEQLQLWLSHGYSKLDQLKLSEGVDRSLSSSAPNGYGDDLANWSNHITKIAMIYKFTQKFEVNSSARIYWGLPGNKDYANYELDTNNVPGYDGSNDRSFEESIFLNMGFKYNFSEKTSLSVNGYNILGIFDDDLNKRNYYGSYGDSRSESPAVSFTLSHKF